MKKQTKHSFDLPFAGIDEYMGFSIVFGDKGDYSIILSITNPVVQYDADETKYSEFHHVLSNIIKLLGEGYIIQKQDIFIRKVYRPVPSGDFLEEKYQEHFNGREFTEIRSYLTITRQVKKGAFYTYDERVLFKFTRDVVKIIEVLQGAGANPVKLGKAEINRLIYRILSLNFERPETVLNNYHCDENQINLGKKSFKCISLIDTDLVELPDTINEYAIRNETNGMQDFPVDNLFFLHRVPDYKVMIFSQVVEIPAQQFILNRLELKRKRHSNMPDPANQLYVEDIDSLLADVAKDNQLLVNSHFSILVCCDSELLERTSNFIESSLFQQGIIPNRNAYNQLELFRCTLPGNAVELKVYDWFLTPADAALCYFFKESLPRNEKTDFLIRFTDRQGIPLAFDPADLSTNRISNRSKFALGPSGSGKSFFMNALLEQYYRYNMDIVIVDTGDSYQGLCNFFGGTYLTYTEENPISMNPFALTREEFNLEKKDFLKTLLAVLWKGVDGKMTQVEDTLLSNVISAYYYDYFYLDSGPQNPERPDKLNFDSFYIYSVDKIREIAEKESLNFDLDEYRFVLKKFFTGQEYGTVLNKDTDASLFEERFVVFEIDNIKESKQLFPIVTLVIMDLFLQKMRNRTFQRKALVIEEAWKAIASPLMAGYILYLYKTVRKFYGEVVVVTQELGDILGNPIVKNSILANSDTICLLDQSKFQSNYDEIAKLLSITDVERRKIFTINKLQNKEDRSRFKEVYIRRGSVGEVYGIEVSLAQYLAFTTEKPEKNAVKMYADYLGNFQDGLTAFIGDLNNSGMALYDFVREVNSKGVQNFISKIQ
ncbi:TraG family conjugative transposon ATPase [Sphingobacterium siyangense]|uniref:Conjugation system TraG family ATPase n=1 Tax=Sphingobacterium siyangense TaxID=459529 RepID=A0A562M7Y6_9SPHI|nr:TraG family conjugative transposon ATPase [Sphingobacterium siyangense]TWI15681.1 conjugation system TraG family ATPase [Sphingobacterium siyangense]